MHNKKTVKKMLHCYFAYWLSKFIKNLTAIEF